MIYYNEFDKGKAAWLRELMKRGAITPGDVDERSIADVTVDDLRGYTRCHFFAGIGLWDRALVESGWPEDREIWTASCPCQPFSSAGRRKGKADERHLWPVLARLVAARRPEFLIGEQVSGADGLAWLDDVFDDLGDCDYTAGAQSAPACGVGAPHRRERLYWVALSNERGREIFTQRHSDALSNPANGDSWWPDIDGCRDTLRTVGDADEAGSQGLRQRRDGADQCAVGAAGVAGDALELTEGDGRQHAEFLGRNGRSTDTGPKARPESEDQFRGPVNGYWRDAAWVYCRDEKYRAVECKTFSVADGNTGDLGRFRVGDTETYITHPLQTKGKARVLRLRGAGDAIVLPQATEWVKAVMSVCA